MFSLDVKDILCCINSSDEGGLLIGHTDVLSRTEQHGRQIEVSTFTFMPCYITRVTKALSFSLV